MKFKQVVNIPNRTQRRPWTRLYNHRFARSTACEQVFLQGSTLKRIQRMIDTLKPEALND